MEFNTVLRREKPKHRFEPANYAKNTSRRRRKSPSGRAPATVNSSGWVASCHPKFIEGMKQNAQTAEEFAARAKDKYESATQHAAKMKIGAEKIRNSALESERKITELKKKLPDEYRLWLQSALWTSKNNVEVVERTAVLAQQYADSAAIYAAQAKETADRFREIIDEKERELQQKKRID